MTTAFRTELGLSVCLSVSTGLQLEITRTKESQGLRYGVTASSVDKIDTARKNQQIAGE